MFSLNFIGDGTTCKIDGGRYSIEYDGKCITESLR